MHNCAHACGSHSILLQPHQCIHTSLPTRSRLLPGPASHPPPSPRDRHIFVVHRRSLYVFGGFDGNSRVNDFMEFRLKEREWRPVVALTGSAPTPRHSHTGVVYK